jgi:hypothetical protein
MDGPTGSTALGRGIPGPEGAERRGFMLQCAEPAEGCADPNDTHVTADIAFSNVNVATVNQTFLDPVTGRTTNVLNVTPPSVHVHVEAGYMPNGSPRITTDYTEGADPSTLVAPQVVHQSLRAEELTDVNVSGQALAFSTPAEIVADPAMNLVGTTANGDITAGWLVDMADTVVKNESTSSTAGGVLRQAIAARLPAAAAFARAERGERVAAALQGVRVVVSRDDEGHIAVEDAEVEGAVRRVSGSGDGSSTAKHTRR